MAPMPNALRKRFRLFATDAIPITIARFDAIASAKRFAHTLPMYTHGRAVQEPVAKAVLRKPSLAESPIPGRYASALEWYFRINFLAIATLALAAWRARIPHHELVPWVVLAYAAILLPGPLARPLLGYGILAAFPFLVKANGYGYSIALNCWLPVLLNLFFTQLARPNLSLFCLAFAYHLLTLGWIHLVFPPADPVMGALGALTNVFAAALLPFALKLIEANLNLSRENRVLAERRKVFGESLKRVVAVVLHDMSRWTGLCNLGIAQAGSGFESMHGHIAQGIRGADELATRIKELLNVDRFALLEAKAIDSLLAELESVIRPTFHVESVCPPGLRGQEVLVDRVILANAILNLAENARKAGARGFRLEAGEAEGKYYIEASDDGCGFPPDVSGMLLREPVPSRNGGTGAGLLNSKFTLAVMMAEIRISDANHGGDGRTRIRIHGLRGPGAED
jgi:signal transduction histidine kinase